MLHRYGMDAMHLEDLEQSAWLEAIARSSPEDRHLPLVCQDGARAYISYWQRGVCPSASARVWTEPVSYDGLGEAALSALDVRREPDPEVTAILREYLAGIYALADARTRWLWLAQTLHHAPGLTGIPSVPLAESERAGFSPSMVSRERRRLLTLARSLREP